MYHLLPTDIVVTTKYMYTTVHLITIEQPNDPMIVGNVYITTRFLSLSPRKTFPSRSICLVEVARLLARKQARAFYDNNLVTKQWTVVRHFSGSVV